MPALASGTQAIMALFRQAAPTELATIFDVIPDAVRMFDAGGQIVRSNELAQRSHRAPPATLAELWQQDQPRSASGSGLALDEHPCARALRGEQVRGERLAVCRGGAESRLVMEVSASPLVGAAGDILGAVMVERDVTAQARLAAGVLHDVNNALNPIRIAAHLLVRHAAEPDVVRDYAARIAKAAEAGAATAARIGRSILQEPMPEGSEAQR